MKITEQNIHHLAPGCTVLNHIHDTVLIEVSDCFSPTLIDLNCVFGTTGLTFSAAAESASVVEVQLIPQRGLLVLHATGASAGERITRVAVRAWAADDVSEVVVFDVRTVSKSVAA